MSNFKEPERLLGPDRRPRSEGGAAEPEGPKLPGRERGGKRDETRHNTHEMGISMQPGAYPTLPECAYVGLAGEVAHFYAETLEPPACFFYLDCLTYLGGALSPYLHTSIKEEPRLYVVKVAPYGAVRKSTAQSHIRDLFEGLPVRVIESVGSGEGLLRQLSRGPVVLMPDEFSRLIKKGKIEGSTLPETLTTLFNETSCSHYLKNDSIEVTDAHLSITSATTPEVYTRTFDPEGIVGGLVSRFYVVVSDERRIKPPAAPDADRVDLYRTKLKVQIEEIKKEVEKSGGRLVLPYAPDAEAHWMEYYSALRQQGDRILERLDTYGLRLAVLLAVTKTEREISRATVESVIALLDYQKEARRSVWPVEASTEIAALEQLILRALADGSRWKRYELYRRVHAEYYGLWAFNKALDNLIGTDWVASSLEGRTRLYSLAPEGREHLGQPG